MLPTAPRWGRRLVARRVGTLRASIASTASTALKQSLADWCAADVARAPEGTLHSAEHNVTLLKHSMHLRPVTRCNGTPIAARTID